MRADRGVGLLLLLTALATGAAFAFRQLASTDQGTTQEILYAIADSRGRYALSGVATILAGLLLWGVGKQLRYTLLPYFSPGGTAAVGLLFIVSGVAAAASGLCAVFLAGMAEGPPAVQPGMAEGIYFAPAVGVLAEMIFPFRPVSWYPAFAIAGIGLVLLSPVVWQISGLLRAMSLVSAILGVSMLFIWVDDAFVVHYVIELAFIAWLLLAGLWLFVPAPRPVDPTLIKPASSEK